MARPHIEYVQVQRLPWDAAVYGDLRPGVDAKVLSVDSEDGECSVLLRYPANWERGVSEHLLVHEELFVLDGAIEIAGVEYGKGFYANLPAGYERPTASSKDGAAVLTFFSATPNAGRGKPANGLYDDALLIKCIDSLGMPWNDRPFDRKIDPGIVYGHNKTLRIDPYTGEITNLFGTGPQTHPDGWAAKLEKHECVEEMYLLTGDIHAGNCGVMQAGAYFWRPADIYHGPYASMAGYVSFFRCIHGKMYNIWSDDKVDFGWNPPYKPVVPPEMEKFVREPPAQTPNF